MSHINDVQSPREHSALSDVSALAMGGEISRLNRAVRGRIGLWLLASISEIAFMLIENRSARA